MPNLIIPTLPGLAEVLAAEVTALGGKDVEPQLRAVTCTGDKEFIYRANLRLRTGLRVLEEIAVFRARNEQMLYDRLRGIDWSEFLRPDGTLWVEATTNSDYFRNSVYLSQLTKDAIVDQFRDRTGQRPSVEKDRPDLTLSVHIGRSNEVSVSLNSSGPGLHRRGYRRRTGGAPINEVLAAGLLGLAGYDGEVPFVDPMCGSGTIVAEAALIAARQAPGFNRNFGFEQWPDFDPALWAGVRQEARELMRTPPHPIVGNDIDELTLNLARVTLDRTGLLPHVSLSARPFDRLPAPVPVSAPAAAPQEEDIIEEKAGGLLVTNPPYEIRLKTGDIGEFYREIGDTLKTNWAGYTAWLITGSPEGAKSVGLRTTRKIPLMNGPLEVRFLRYDLYRGSKKRTGEA